MAATSIKGDMPRAELTAAPSVKVSQQLFSPISSSFSIISSIM